MITGDLYRNACHIEISFNHPYGIVINKKAPVENVYMKSNDAEALLSNILIKSPETIDSRHIFLHGSDRTISLPLATHLQNIGVIISSVNWLDDQKIVRPLPIGVATRNRLGKVSKEIYELYLQGLNNKSGKSFDKRSISLYVNFDLTTNIIFRKSALISAIDTSGAYFINDRISVLENVALISDSRFVLSPPGVGADCFRTWEAMYSGAVPIVLKSHWPFFSYDLPVLVVDNYENLEFEMSSFDSTRLDRRVSLENLFHP